MGKRLIVGLALFLTIANLPAEASFCGDILNRIRGLPSPNKTSKSLSPLTPFQLNVQAAQKEINQSISDARFSFWSANWSMRGARYASSAVSILGSRFLKYMSETTAVSLALVRENSHLIHGAVLEIGPYYMPIVLPSRFPEAKAVYWEYDQGAANYLTKKVLKGDQSRVLSVDLNELDADFKQSFREKNKIALKNLASPEGYQAIIVSQVLNYVELDVAIQYFSEFLAPGGYLLISNLLHHGTSPDFHILRPQTTEAISESVEKVPGMVVVDEQVHWIDEKPLSWVVARKE